MPQARGPRFLTLSAEEVARQGYRGFMDGHRVVVPGAGNRLITVLSRLLPRRTVMAIMNRRQMRRERL